MTKSTAEKIVNDIPVCELINTDPSPFWFTNEKFNKRYQHENGQSGDKFLDGNNGDTWEVQAINPDYHRAVVANRTQGGMMIVYWN